jgi:hypothetical protein
MRHVLAPLVVVAAALVTPATVIGQSEVTMEVGASHIGPPSGVDAATARFAVTGIRASKYSSDGSGIFTSVLVGRSFGPASGGDFLSGTLGGTMQQDWGAGWTAGVDVRALGFTVRAPFPYRALAAEGGPTLRYRSGRVSVKLKGLAGIGTSRMQLRRRPDTPVVRTINQDLWRMGGTTEVLIGAGNAWVGLGGGAHRTSGGTYTAGGLRLILGGTQAAAEVRLDVWDTPAGTETTGGIAIVIPVRGNWSLRGFLGRSEPDPMTLAEPGSGSGGLLLGRTVYRGGITNGRASLHEIIAGTETGARVRISVTAPATATRVEVMGDFGLWDPVPMLQESGRWTVVLEIASGIHHFGFLVDDEWFVPDDAPDVVPDEWGRRSATLVIEGVGS